MSKKSKDQNRFSWGSIASSGGSWGGGWSGWGGAGTGAYSGWWDDNAPITDGTQIIAHDGYDRISASRVVGPYGKVGKEIQPLKEDLPTSTALGNDLYWSLYKRNVKKQEIPLRESFRINEELLDAVLESDEYIDLHATAMGDSFLAETAAGQLIPSLLSHLSDETKERVKRQKEMEDQLKNLRARAIALEELHEQNPSQRLQEGLEANAVSIADLEKQIEELRGRLSAEEREAVRKHLQGQMVQTNQNLNTVAQGFRALGGSMGGGGLAYAQGVTAAFGRDGKGNERKMTIAAKILNDKKLRMIADLAGRMADVAFQVQASKSPDPTDELTDTRQSDDVARLLSSEMLYLVEPELEDIFLYRYVNKQLMTYEIRGYTPQGRGPIVVMIDNSGSMSGAPEEWSKAVMLALRMIAEQQKRDFYVIHFDSTVQRTDEFIKGVADPEKMLANIEFFSGGGTNFEPPMRAAMKKMRESRYRNADAIFITDGLCGIRDEECREWNQIREKSGMKSYCILIGNDSWGRGVMEKLTDRMMVIEPDKILEEKDESSEVLQTVFGV